MSTHQALQVTGRRTPFILARVPTPSPSAREVLVRVTWVASGPIDLRIADSGLHVSSYPRGLGGSGAGVVVAVGPDVQHLAVGDHVSFLGIGGPHQYTFQEYWLDDERATAKTPEGLSDQEAVTVPSNFVTVVHALTHDLGLQLPWPFPASVENAQADSPFLVWGASSSVGQYALQVLRAYGFSNIVATASRRHHELLRSLGARHVFDYRDSGVLDALLAAAEPVALGKPSYSYIVDCIGSKKGSLEPLSRIAQAGSRVASMLPVHFDDDPSHVTFGMDVAGSVAWADGVVARGVKTMTYRDDPILREHLLQDMLPFFLATGRIVPNKQRVVGGDSPLIRAERARELLRSGQISGERLVWQF